MINKKGELTTQQIVMLVILITSFVIILVFMFLLDLGETTNEQLCHNSVATRGSSVIPSGSIPLDCRTTYVCLTEDGSCERMTNPEVKKVGNKLEVYKILAEEMAQCWWMFGEGKINYVGDDFTHNNYCSICNQVGFDDSVQGILGKSLDKDDFYDYLKATEKSGGVSYSDYLFGRGKLEELESELSKKGSVSFGEIDLDKQSYIVMGIISEVDGWVSTLAGIGAGVGIVIGTVTTGGVFGYVVAGALVGGAGGFIGDGVFSAINPTISSITVKGSSGNDFLAPTLIEADSDKFELLNCEEVNTFS